MHASNARGARPRWHARLLGTGGGAWGCGAASAEHAVGEGSCGKDAVMTRVATTGESEG